MSISKNWLRNIGLIVIAIFIIVSANWVFSQESENGQQAEESPPKKSFSDLKELDLIEYPEIYYNENLTEVIFKSRIELPKDDPFYKDKTYQSHNIVLMKTKITSNSSQQYIIILDQEFGVGHTIHIYYANSSERFLGGFIGDEVYIPGNGFIYVSCRWGKAFNVRKKYKIDDGQLVEVKQSFYYVGLKTRTFQPVPLYSSKACNEIIAQIPPDYEIEILLASDEGECNEEMTFLVKTSFGLVGWLKLYLRYTRNPVLDGLYFIGIS